MTDVLHVRARTTPPVVAAALCLLAACGGDGSTGVAEDDARISLTVKSVGNPAIRQLPNGEPRIRCRVTLRASATGRGAAIWEAALFTTYIGADRDVSLGTTAEGEEEVQAAWGGERLNAGASAESQWEFEASAPFRISAEFRYYPSLDHPAASAPVSFDCGPQMSSASPLPSIGDQSAAVFPDNPEPGDTIVVSYTANSTLGLWTTGVELSGPCGALVLFNEELRGNVSRTVRVPIPNACALNSPLLVTVVATDAGLRTVGRQIASRVLSDVTPPTLIGQLVVPDNSASPAVLFTGDSIHVAVIAEDNNAVRHVVYELLPVGRRDSLAVASRFNGEIRIPLTPMDTGLFQVRVYARDIAGLTSNVFATAADGIRVYPTVQRPTQATTFLGGVRDLVIDVDRDAIYVAHATVSRISVLSTTTLQVVRSIDLPYRPLSLDYSPGGDSLVVAHEGGLGVVDLRPVTPVVSDLPLTLNASLAQRPSRVVVLANGKAYVPLDGNSAPAGQLLEVDLRTGANRVRTDATDANGSAAALWLQRSPDRTVFVFNGGAGHFRRYDAASDSFLVGDAPSWAQVMPSLDIGGQHTALHLDIYDASLRHLRRVQSMFVPVAPVPALSHISPDGEFLYYSAARGVVRARVSDGTLLDRTLNPISPAMIRVASDNSFILTAGGWEFAQLSLIRLQ